MASSSGDKLHQRDFATTQWSIVLNAGRDSSPQREESLATLCSTYWFPLYAFVRRQGYDSQNSQDLTQGFFAKLLERRDIDGVDRSKGRFRSFLLASMKHYLINEWDKQRAVKRGGRQTTLSLDFEQAESRYALEPSHDTTADAVFDRQWGLTLLDQVRSKLAAEHSTAEQQKQYEQLQSYLTGEPTSQTYRSVAEQLDMTEGAVKVAVHRLRKRFGKLLRELIGETVANESEVDDELRELFSVLQAK